MRGSNEPTAVYFASADLAHSFEGNFTEILGEYVFSALSLAMASVTNHRNSHLALSFVIGKDTLETIGETEKVSICSKTSL